MWRCHRGVVDAIQPPWLGEKYSTDGCDILRCTCNWFRDKAVAKNFRITIAGWADHTVTATGGN